MVTAVSVMETQAILVINAQRSRLVTIHPNRAYASSTTNERGQICPGLTAALQAR